MENETAALASFSTLSLPLFSSWGHILWGTMYPRHSAWLQLHPILSEGEQGVWLLVGLGHYPGIPFLPMPALGLFQINNENMMREEGLFWLRVEFLTGLIGKENGSGTGSTSM